MEQGSSYNIVASEKYTNVDDHMNGLPDDILSHILTFLNLKEAFKTRVLSRRWRRLCVHTSNLVFDLASIFNLDPEQLSDYSIISSLRHRFVERVDELLMRITAIKPVTLKIHFPLGEDFASHINNWINFAIRMECVEINLDFHGAANANDGNNPKPYSFPFHLLVLCKKSILKDLFLRKCIFKPTLGAVNRLNLLKSLRLVEVHVEASDLDIILSGCLNLELLKLVYCELPSNLSICGQDLKLKSVDVSSSNVVEKIDLNVPNLATFKYEGDIPHFTFSRLHQLTYVVLEIHGTTETGLNQLLDEISINVPHLQTLGLGWYSNQDDTPPFDDDDDDNENWMYAQLVPTCLSTCLKEVSFVSFNGDECEVEYAGYLLKNASVLETMEITIIVSGRRAQRRIINKIKAFPRSSDRCQVIFYDWSSFDSHPVVVHKIGPE